MKKETTPADEHKENRGMPEERKAEHRTKRLASLDAFRGLTILGMLLVNNVAVDIFTPRQLTHAPWNGGIYFADLVFPWFLYIVGVSVPFAAASRRQKGVSTRNYIFNVLKRAAMLVFLGCLVDSSIAHTPLFALGVLQLIGLAYLVASLVYLLPLPARLSITAVFLAAHWGAIKYIPIPGIGAGHFAENINLIKYLDHTYLKEIHLKGLISVIPTSALVILGSTIGDLLRKEMKGLRKFLWLATVGIVLMFVGKLWSLDIPFNKPVWTASYILFSAGFGTLVLGFLYLAIDVCRVGFWAFPFVVLGTNAIMAYVVPILVKMYILQGWRWGGSSLSLQDTILGYLSRHYGQLNGGWLYTALYITFWWLILLYMYHKRLFLRV